MKYFIILSVLVIAGCASSKNVAGDCNQTPFATMVDCLETKRAEMSNPGFFTRAVPSARPGSLLSVMNAYAHWSTDRELFMLYVDFARLLAGQIENAELAEPQARLQLSLAAVEFNRVFHQQRNATGPKTRCDIEEQFGFRTHYEITCY